MEYRKIIRDGVAERKKFDSSFNFQKMATHMGIQKSYLSKVIGGNADLNPDQLFLACEFLGFDEKQRRYMALLLEHARSAVKRRKDQLAAEIRKIQAKYRETKEHLAAPVAEVDVAGAGEYYLDPLNQLVHISLSIPRYRENPATLAKDLAIPVSRVQGSIAKLEQLGIVRREGKSLRIVIEDIHLPRESPVYRAWRNQVRLLSMRRMEDLGKENSYSFSVTFSADADAKNRIQAAFIDFLKETEKYVKAAPSEDSFQINFDLFSWTQT